MTRTWILAGVIAAVGACPALAQASGADTASIIARADSNGDGAVSRDELLAARSSAFARLDHDGDGAFSTSELPARAMSRPRAQQAIAAAQQFDADGDGVITEAEFVNGPTAAFDMADANADGVVTPDEIDVAREIFSATGQP